MPDLNSFRVIIMRWSFQGTLDRKSGNQGSYSSYTTDLLASWPLTSNCIFLSIAFFICKYRILSRSTFYKCSMEHHWGSMVKYLGNTASCIFLAIPNAHSYIKVSDKSCRGVKYSFSLYKSSIPKLFELVVIVVLFLWTISWHFLEYSSIVFPSVWETGMGDS